MGKIYYVMGKSSSGKDTIYKKLMEAHPRFRTIVPYTTRPIREGERDGVEYFFVDKERLREMQEAGAFCQNGTGNSSGRRRLLCRREQRSRSIFRNFICI